MEHTSQDIVLVISVRENAPSIRSVRITDIIMLVCAVAFLLGAGAVALVAVGAGKAGTCRKKGRKT